MDVIYEPRGRAREYAPLAANLYSGCSHGCTYCYAPGALRRDRKNFHASPCPRAGILKELEKSAARVDPSAGYVLLSFTTDPHQPIDVTYGLTREAIKILHAAGHRVEILTKGGSRASRDFDLYLSGDKFATTLTFDNDEESKKWEPIAALPSDRIETIRVAHNMGIETWVSFEPVIRPEQVLGLIDATHEYVDLYKVGTLNHHPDAKKIDWPRFLGDVTARLKHHGKRYYIKNDLAKYGPQPSA